VAVLGAAGLGACALLAACSPVQMGAAATVGSQRITTSALDRQISTLQAAATPYGSSIQLTSAQMPDLVLSWLIRFAVMDQVAADHGISVTPAQSKAALNSLSAVAEQDGFSSTSELLVANGVSPQMFDQVGTWEAQQDVFAEKNNGGKEPATSAQESAFTAAIDKAQCSAAQTLNIKVSPQFGRFDYASSSFSVVAGTNTLSQPEGTPKPASTAGLTPAAC
jgi:hypothetical protein